MRWSRRSIAQVLLAMSVTIAVGFFALWLLESGLQAGPAPSPPLLPEPDSVRWARLPKPEFVEGILANGLHTHRDTVEKHQRLTDLLRGYYLSPVVWQQLNQLDRNTFDFRKVTAGKKYTVSFNRIPFGHFMPLCMNQTMWSM